MDYAQTGFPTFLCAETIEECPRTSETCRLAWEQIHFAQKIAIVSALHLSFEYRTWHYAQQILDAVHFSFHCKIFERRDKHHGILWPRLFSCQNKGRYLRGEEIRRLFQ